MNDEPNLLDPYAPTPFWMWNGRMEISEIHTQMEEMFEAGVRQFFIHAREGLETPYLSEDWFQAVEACLRKAKSLGMEVWIYDELNWPSGTAGGKVLESDAGLAGSHVVLEHVSDPGTGLQILQVPTGELLAVYARQGGEGSEEHIDPLPWEAEGESKIRVQFPDGAREALLAMTRPNSWKVAYETRPYVDLLSERAVKEFLAETHDQYFNRFSEYFGSVLVGFYTDEPGLYANLFGSDAGSLPWTPGFSRAYARYFGIEFESDLPFLWIEAGKRTVRARLRYFRALSRLYQRNFFKRIRQWCRKRNVIFMGHLLEEENLAHSILSQGDFFGAMAHFDIPGVDLIGEMSDSKSITFKLGSSAAHHEGAVRFSCETFGIFGWGLTLAHMKQVLDWQVVRGLDFMIPHAFHYSMEGERKRECPPSLFRDNLLWAHYPRWHRYAAGISRLMSQGDHVAHLAVHYPLTSAWASLDPGDLSSLANLDATLKEITRELLSHQIDFDFVGDKVLSGGARVQEGKLWVGGESYSLLVMPDASVLPLESLETIARFVSAGGTVLWLDHTPRHPEWEGDRSRFEELCGLLIPTDETEGEGSFLLRRLGVGQSIRMKVRTSCGQAPPSSKTLNTVTARVSATKGDLWLSLKRWAQIPWVNSLARRFPRLRRRVTSALEPKPPAVMETEGSSSFVKLVRRFCPGDVHTIPHDPNLRYQHRSMTGRHRYFITNECDAKRIIEMKLESRGEPRRISPETGSESTIFPYRHEGGGTVLTLDLEPFESAVIDLSPDGSNLTVPVTNFHRVEEVKESPQGLQVRALAERNGKHSIQIMNGARDFQNTVSVHGVPAPRELQKPWNIQFEENGSGAKSFKGDLRFWSKMGRPHFSGRADYQVEFRLSAKEQRCRVELHLGEIREIAEVKLNGHDLGAVLWGPNQIELPADCLRDRNTLHVLVTNTLANRLEKDPRPSGLLGPVRLRFLKEVRLEFENAGNGASRL